MKIDKKFKKIIKSFWTDERGYARFYLDKNNQSVRVHRYVMEKNGFKIKNKEVDHVNGIKTDNRICNLRLANRSQNMRNQKRKDKGVRKLNNKWQARITINKKCLYLGGFETKKEALLAYDKASKKYHKQFGVCNEKN